MRHLSVMTLILLLIILSSCDKIKFFGKKARALAEMQMLARQDSIRVADSLRRAQDYLLSIENARLDSIRIAEEERLANETKYNIIVGSFLTPEYAKDLAQEYDKMGYKTEIIKMANSKFELVAAEGHKSLKKAIARLAAFQDTVQIESWIYIRQ